MVFANYDKFLSGRAADKVVFEPQVTIGLLVGQSGFPLMLPAFEETRGRDQDHAPVIGEFMAAHQLPDVTVVADAGMISDANMKAVEAAGLWFILLADLDSQVRPMPVRLPPSGHRL